MKKQRLLALLLHPQGALTYRALAQQLGVSFQAVQKAFETLERRGLVQASPRHIWGRHWAHTDAAQRDDRRDRFPGDSTP